jgi:hypothetical protein
MMISDHGSVQLMMLWCAEVIFRPRMIKQIFGVCLVSIMGGHQRD